MTKKQSAGLLVYRRRETGVDVLLVHPGGPFWKNKDDGAWSIPKGEFSEGEEALDAAKREFHEEIGVAVEGAFAEGAFRPLAPVKLKSGKTVFAWAIEKDIDVSSFHSNSFTMEWPPKSGQIQEFPEIDRAEWFSFHEARAKINPGQFTFLDELGALLHPK